LRRLATPALYAFGYAFLPILGGIVVLAAGVKKGIVDYGEPATAATAWFLAAGTAVYVAGLALFRLLLRTGPVGTRLGVAAMALVTVVVGLGISPEAQLAALTAVGVIGIVLEPRATRGVQRPA
jgi:low temperature requirement protein LtrA